MIEHFSTRGSCPGRRGKGLASRAKGFKKVSKESIDAGERERHARSLGT